MSDPDPRELALAGLMMRPKPELGNREQGDEQQVDQGPESTPDSLADVATSMHDIVGNGLMNAALSGDADSGIEHSVAAAMGAAVAGLGGWAGSSFSSNTVMRDALHRHGSRPAPSAPKLNKGGGRPLSDDVRIRMEAAMGRDFSHVRIHTDGTAQTRARDIDARAFTVGSDIYFGSGEYQPGTTQGDRLLGHELTHVIQHDEGRLSLPDSKRTVSLPTDPTEVEAYANEKRVLSALQQVDTAIADGLPMAEPTPLMNGARIMEMVTEVSGGVPDSVEMEAGAPSGAAATTASRSEEEAAERPSSVPPEEEQLIGEVPEAGEKKQVAPPPPTPGQAESGPQGPATQAVVAAGGPAAGAGAAPGAAAPEGAPAAAAAAVETAPVLGVVKGPDLLDTAPSRPDLSAVGTDLSSFAKGAVAASAATGVATRHAGDVAHKASFLSDDLAAMGASVMTDIETRVGQAVGEIHALHDQIAAQVSSAFDAQIAAVNAQRESAAASIAAAQAQQRAALTAQAEAQRVRVRTEVEACRTLGEQFGNQTKASILQLGESEAERAIAESETRAQKALGLSTEVNSTGDKVCADAQQESATKIGEKAAEKCRDTGAKMAEEVRKQAAEVAAEVDKKRDEYLAGLGDGVGQVEGHVDELEQRGLAQVDGVAAQGLSAVQALTTEGLGALQQGRSKALGALSAMRDQTAAQFQEAGGVLTEQLQPQIDDVQQMFAAFGASAQAELTGMEGQDTGQVDAARQHCATQLDQQHASTREGLDELSQASMEEIAALLEAVTAEMTEAGNRATADADALGAGISDGINKAATGVLTSMASTVAETMNSMRAGVDELVQQYTSARQEYEQGIQGMHDEARTAMADSIAKGLAKEDEFVQEARGETQRAAEEIGGEYETLKAEADAKGGKEEAHRGWLGNAWKKVTDTVSSVVAKVREWFLSTFGDFWGGLLFGILQGLVIVALAVAAVSVIGAVVGLVIASAKVAAIVTLCIVVAVGIAGGIYARFQEFYADNPGQDVGFWRGLALVGLGVADLTGIPMVVEGMVGQRAFGAEMTTAERTERFGMGLVFFGAAIFGGIRAWKSRGNSPKGQVPKDGPESRSTAPKDGPETRPSTPKDGPESAPKDGPESAPKDGPETRQQGDASAPKTLDELTSQLSTEGREGLQQFRSKNGDKALEGMTNRMRKDNGAYDLDALDAKFRQYLTKQRQNAVRVAEERVTKIENILRQTSKEGRAKASIGDGSSEAALLFEARTGTPVGGKGHSIKVRQSISDLAQCVAELKTHRRNVLDADLRARVDSAIQRANDRIPGMKAAEQTWSERATRYPEVWNSDGSSKVHTAADGTGWPPENYR